MKKLIERFNKVEGGYFSFNAFISYGKYPRGKYLKVGKWVFKYRPDQGLLFPYRTYESCVPGYNYTPYIAKYIEDAYIEKPEGEDVCHLDGDFSVCPPLHFEDKAKVKEQQRKSQIRANKINHGETPEIRSQAFRDLVYELKIPDTTKLKLIWGSDVRNYYGSKDNPMGLPKHLYE